MGYKHVGRIKSNKRKVIVAYRTVPGEADSCIVVTTQNLMSDEHDSLIKAVESDTGQSANEFAEAMARVQLPDGRNMLAAFHTTGKMIKVKTSEVEMTPDRTTVIGLDELNELIAQQRGVTIDDLAIGSSRVSPVETPDQTNVTITETLNTSDGTKVLTDAEIADKYRRDAAQLTKEAKRLRDEAELLSPSKKRKASTNVKETNNTSAKSTVKSTSRKRTSSRSVETDI